MTGFIQAGIIGAMFIAVIQYTQTGIACYIGVTGVVYFTIKEMGRNWQ